MATIRANNKELTEGADFSSLSAPVTSGGSTISVYSIANFAINKILLIGEFGQEGSEIIATHSSTAPTGTTVTLTTTLTKSHPKDTKVYIIPYNQAQFFHTTTPTGDKTQIGSNTDVNKESVETIYTDTVYTSGQYFTRFYDSVNNTYSDYSDALPVAGHESNTVGYIINHALTSLGKTYSDILTYDKLLEEINSCLRFIRGKLKRWSNVQEFDYILDQIDRGEYKWALPTTYYDKNSNRSMLQVRVGAGTALIYKDKIEFDEYFDDVAKSQVATAGAVGETSLVLDSTDDFPSSGTIHYYISNTAYSVDFSANSKSTNTLTTDALTVITPVDTNIWYGESESTPAYFSVWDGYLYIWPLTDATDYGENIYLDFYTDIIEVDSDSDEITLARHDMVKHWLKWQIRNITENNGKTNIQDGDWLMFNSILNDAIRRESSGQKFKMKPKVSGIKYPGSQSQSYDDYLKS